ncbi:unnamed protein product [Rotaria magnacalcarata]
MDASILPIFVVFHLLIHSCLCAYFPPLDATWQKEAKTVVGSDQISEPGGIFIDRHNTLFIADQYNYRILKLEYGSVKTTLVMDGLNYPDDLVIDSEGTMFIAEKESLTRWPKGARSGTVLGRAQWLLSVALDSKEEYLYVTDYMTSYVMKYSAKGGAEQNGTIVIPDTYEPWSVAVDENGAIYVAKFDGNVVKWKKNESGKGKIVVDQLGEPRGISVDSHGTLYIANCGGNSIVRVLAGSKNATIIAAGNGIGDAPNQLYNPDDLAFDSYGNLYVSDYGNSRVQMFKINIKSSSNS